MDPTDAIFLMLIALIVMVIVGIHIGLALGTTSIVGTYLLFESADMAAAQVGSAAFFVLRDYVFAVIPLFVLMGEFVSKSGSAGDLYKTMNHAMRRVPGRLAVATVAGNAVFAAVTGTSLASAATFSRLAYPEMIANNYKRTFALGSVAGSASLGMLIPPSVLMIIWGIVTEISIGNLFVAGIIPGLILAGLMALYSMGHAMIDPTVAPRVNMATEAPLTRDETISGLGVIVLIFVVLGGLFAGWFTPQESAAVGAIGGLILAVIKGVRWHGIRESIIDSGKVIAPIMFLLLTAQMYSRLLASGGVITIISDTISHSGLDHNTIIFFMIVMWLVLGTLLDSGSIILLTVPIFWPVVQAFGFNEYAFAILGILAIEAGLLTPPVGLLVYAVKGAVEDKTVTLMEIFTGSIPYWILMLIVMGMIWAYPPISSWLTTV
jgi:tripartite ATP-independent transporter DctM subunit